MAKTVFFDVDGTLLSHVTGRVPDSARRAVAALRRAGLRVGLATGRSFDELGDLPLEGLEFDVLLTLNGQLVLDGDGGYVAGNPLTGEALRSVLELFESQEVSVLLVQMGRMYVNKVDESVVAAQRAIHTPAPRWAPTMGERSTKPYSLWTRTRLPRLRIGSRGATSRAGTSVPWT